MFLQGSVPERVSGSGGKLFFRSSVPGKVAEAVERRLFEEACLEERMEVSEKCFCGTLGHRMEE